jgi:hypothetical protein
MNYIKFVNKQRKPLLFSELRYDYLGFYLKLWIYVSILFFILIIETSAIIA